MSPAELTRLHVLLAKAAKPQWQTTRLVLPWMLLGWAAGFMIIYMLA